LIHFDYYNILYTDWNFIPSRNFKIQYGGRIRMCANTKKPWIVKFEKGNEKGIIDVPEGLIKAAEIANIKMRLGYKITTRPKEDEDYGHQSINREKL